MVCKKKLPQGIEGLIASAKKCGIKFGLWIEPEMVNSKSELYEKHPDWIICQDNRTPTTGRGGTQMIRRPFKSQGAGLSFWSGR